MGVMREAALFDDLPRNPPMGEAATGPWRRGSSSMNVVSDLQSAA